MRCHCLLLLALLAALVQSKTYNGYQVLRTRELGAESAEFINFLESTDVRFDFWKSGREGGMAEIMAGPDDLDDLKAILDEAKIGHDVAFEDVQSHIGEASASKGQRLQGKKTADYELNWDDYYDHAVINAFLDEMARTHDFVETVSIGKSYEGRDMKVLKIMKAGEGAPNVWIEAGIHAREWISPAVTTYLIRELVENYALHPEYVDNVNYHILPSANPDGYAYTFSNDRMWRKTRKPNSACVGTDSNRNYDYMWGTTGTSSNPCSDSYMGTSPFSEVENSNIRDYVQSLSPVPALATALHSYGKLWLFPYGHSFDRPSNVNEIIELGDAAVAALRDVHGTKFTNKQSSALYPASGDSNDWYTGVVGVRFSYTIELRGNSFVLPPDEIVPSGEELWAAYKVCIDKIMETQPRPI
jgi:carboxypeptidase A4